MKRKDAFVQHLKSLRHWIINMDTNEFSWKDWRPTELQTKKAMFYKIYVDLGKDEGDEDNCKSYISIKPYLSNAIPASGKFVGTSRIKYTSNNLKRTTFLCQLQRRST